MDLLFVSPWYPWPATTAGAHQRIYHLLAAFSERHRVTLVAPADAGETSIADDPLPAMCARVIRVPEPLPIAGGAASATRWSTARQLGDLLTSPLPRSTRWRHEALVRVLRQLRSTCHFDVVWVERAFLAELVREAGFERIVVDVDDVQSIAMTRHLRHHGRTHP